MTTEHKISHRKAPPVGVNFTFAMRRRLEEMSRREFRPLARTVEMLALEALAARDALADSDLADRHFSDALVRARPEDIEQLQSKGRLDVAS